MKSNIEIEARFIKINKPQIITTLHRLNAVDLGEDLMQELIFYDKDLTWRDQQKFVRLRKTNGKIYLTFKHHKETKVDGTTEIELEVNSLLKAKKFLVSLGLVCFREQEKRRHKFLLDGVFLDIDTWPGIPTYLEIEGKSEDQIKKVAKKLGLDYKNALFIDARGIIETIYNIPVSTYRHFTFKKVG